MKHATAFATIVLAIGSFVSILDGPAKADRLDQAVQPPHTDPVRAELVSEHQGIRPGEPFWVGVRLEMKDGWHINWVNPGDAGLPPVVEWTLPPGFSAGEVAWPYPRRYDISGLSIFGYDDEVLLMCELTPTGDLAAGQTVTIGAGVTWLACREACLPGEADLTLSLPVVAKTETVLPDSLWRTAFERSRSEVPLPLDGWRTEAAASDDYLVIEFTPLEGEAPAVESAALFPFQQGIIENSAPQVWKKSGATYRLEVRRDRMSSDKPKRIAGILFSQNGWGKDGRKAVVIDIAVD